MKKVKKVFSVSTRLILKIIEITLAFIIVISSIGLIRLYTHPIEIKEYLPTLEEYILPPDTGLKLQADSLTLSAGFKKSGILHISIKNMQLLHSDGQSVMHLPDVVLSYDLWQILKLDYMPNDVSITDASFHLTITNDNKLHLYGEDKKTSSEKVPEKTETVILDKDGTSPIRKTIQHLLSFEKVSLKNGNLIINDQKKGKSFDLKEINIDIEQQYKGNYALKAQSAITIQNRLTRLNLEAQLNRFSKKMSFDIEFDKLYLKDISQLIPVLKDANFTIDGHIKGIFDFSHECQDIVSCFKGGTFQISNISEGTLSLPEPLTNLYHIEKLKINGALSEDLEKIKIARSFVKLKDGPKADIEVEVSGIGAFLIDNNLENVKTVLKSNISSLPIEQAPAVWPPATGPNAHGWVSRNLSLGRIEKADFALYFTGGNLVDLYGEIPVSDIHVNYLDGMTPVHNFNGLVKLWPNRVLITGNSAKVMDISLKEATVDLTDLDKEVSNAKIILSMTGPVQDAMQLISEKPLEFAQMFGLNPKETGGSSDIKLDLNFPLIDNLTTSQVQVNVQADIQKAIFPTPIKEQKLTDGKFQLNVNNKGLELIGNGKIDQIPLNLTWRESFTAKQETDIQSQYIISSQFNTDLLKNLWPDAHTYFDGNVALKGDILRQQNGITTGQFDLDLTQSELFLIPISTQKDKDIPATLALTFSNNKDKTTFNYDLKSSVDEKALNPIIIRGEFIANSKTQRLNLTEILAPKNNFNGFVEWTQDTITGDINGKSWNLSALHHTPEEPEEKSEKSLQVFVPPKNIDINIKIDRLILNEEEPITNLLGNFKKEKGLWKKLSLNAIAGVPFNMAYQPKKQTLMATTTDFGALLNHIGLINRIDKGDFSLNLKQQNTGGFKGEAYIKNFKLKDTSFWMQAITILGIVDGIRGKDLSFDQAKIPLIIENKPALSLSIEEGYMSGTNLGITFNGQLTTAELKMFGSIITAYAINSLPGKIPFIGALFKDGEGGGLFGVKYDITGSPFKPEISFNTLSSIAPGILGTLFQ